MDGRHPLQELFDSDASFISNETKLDEIDRIHFITGANYSGKSVYMKQVYLEHHRHDRRLLLLFTWHKLECFALEKLQLV